MLKERGDIDAALFPSAQSTAATVESILKRIEEFVVISSQRDAFLVAGSHIEGFGDHFSDIDVHSVSSKRPAARQWRNSEVSRLLSIDRSLLSTDDTNADVFIAQYFLQSSLVKVDTEYRTFEEVDRLTSDVSLIFDYARRNLALLTKTLSPRDMAFVHRLFSGTFCRGAAYLESLREKIPRDAWCYLLYRWKATDFSVLLDLIGAYRAGDVWRAADIARENLLAQLQALTHIAGNTNYRRKWVFHYAKRLGLRSDLVEATELHLHSASGPSAEQHDAYVRAALKISRGLIREAAVYLSALDVPHGATAIRMLDAQAAGSSPYSVLESGYRKLAYVDGDFDFESLLALQ